MSATLEQLAAWMEAEEAEHLEFKEAKTSFDRAKLVEYCAALANEGGGHLVLGVSDKRPRRVVGSKALPDLGNVKHLLVERLRLRVDADELPHPDGRVLVFSVPSRPIGVPISVDGAYLMRSGESLVAMTPDFLRGIFSEGQPDFSATVCPGASLVDLSPEAIQLFRDRWEAHSGNAALKQLSDERLLADAELVVNGGITYAALVLLGTHQAMGRHLAQAEVIFEYRSREGSIEFQQRTENRRGFLLFHDELWGTVNLRNDLFSYQDGLYRVEVPSFNELAVREAVLNAVSHRDYRLQGSTFVKQWPTRIQIVSPGGFPSGVSASNILERQAPRNRRLADALARCGLVERSGQGADRMFSTAVREAKLPPDFDQTDAYQVSVTLSGKVQDERFLKFLSGLAKEAGEPLSLDDLLVLDAVHREQPVPGRLAARVSALIELGALERVGGKNLLLSKRFYVFAGKPGEHTRRMGLDRPASKALLLQHIVSSGADGCPLAELNDVLPSMKRMDVKNMLQELKSEGKAHVAGKTRGARWVAGAGGDDPE